MGNSKSEQLSSLVKKLDMNDWIKIEDQGVC
jgi:hypothetical protein